MQEEKEEGPVEQSVALLRLFGVLNARVWGADAEPDGCWQELPTHM